MHVHNIQCLEMGSKMAYILGVAGKGIFFAKAFLPRSKVRMFPDTLAQILLFLVAALMSFEKDAPQCSQPTFMRKNWNDFEKT